MFISRWSEPRPNDDDDDLLPTWCYSVLEATRTACMWTSALLCITTPLLVLWSVQAGERQFSSFERWAVGTDLIVLTTTFLQSHLRNCKRIRLPPYAIPLLSFLGYTAKTLYGVAIDQKFKLTDCLCRRTFLVFMPTCFVAITLELTIVMMAASRRIKDLEEMFKANGKPILIHGGLAMVSIFLLLLTAVLLLQPDDSLCVFLHFVGLCSSFSVFLIIWMFLTPSYEDLMCENRTEDPSIVVSFACNSVAFALLFEHFVLTYFGRFFMQLVAQTCLFAVTYESFLFHSAGKCYEVFSVKDLSA